MNNNIEVKIAVTNLGKYNEGDLVFTWLELPATEEEIEKALEKIGVKNNTEYEEYFITDFETNIEDLKIGEYENLQELSNIIEELQNTDASTELLQAIVEAETSDLNKLLEYVQDNIEFYEGQSMEDVAHLIVEECYDLPEVAQRYFDYEAFAHDLSFDGFTETATGVIRFE